MRSSDVPPKFPIPFGNNASAPLIRPIPVNSQIGILDGAASLQTGFPPDTFVPTTAGGVPPWGADFNGLLFQVTQWSRWQGAGGPVFWDSAFSAAAGGYPQGAIVSSLYGLGYYWISTVDNNLSNPDAHGAGWTQFTLINNGVFNVKNYGAIGDGSSHPLSTVFGSLTQAQAVYPKATSLSQELDWAGFQAAIDAAGSQPVYAPSGTYLINSLVGRVATTVGVFTPGMRLYGDGIDNTIIDNRCTSGSCIYVGSNGANDVFQLGGYIKDLTITTTTSSLAPGIELRAVYLYLVENVRIENLQGNGCIITNLLGDGDASNVVVFRFCQFYFINGAGLLNNCATAVVQTSFVRCEDSEFFTCRLCGWYFIGAAGSMENCGFTECGGQVDIHSNPTGIGGFAIINNGGANDLFDMNNVSFENNFIQSVLCQSLQGGTWSNCEVASAGTVHPQTVGINLSNTGGVRITGTRVRITQSGSYTMFNLDTTTFANTIDNTYWLPSWDDTNPAHFRYVNLGMGNRVSDSFDCVVVGDPFTGSAGIVVGNGTNHDVALPPDGTVFLTGGPTAAFSITGFTGGQDGRSLELINTSGSVMTIVHEGGSSPNNRIWLSGGGPTIIVNNQGFVTFRYVANLGGSPVNSRWVLKSHS